MKVHNRLLFTACVLTFGTAAAAPLSSYNARYEVFVNGFDAGKQTQTLSVKRNRYQLNQSINAGFAYFSIHTQTSSIGRYRDRWLPQHYEFEQKTLHHNKALKLDFNHRTGRISSEHEGDTTSYAFRGRADDPLSLQLNLRTQLRHRRVTDQNFFRVAARKHLTDYALKWEGREEVDTPWGKVAAVKLSHEDKKHQQMTTFWLAPKYQFLPVQILFHEKGMNIRANIRVLEGFGKKLGLETEQQK